MPKLISLTSIFKLPTTKRASSNAQAVKPNLTKPEQHNTLKPVTIHLAQRDVRAASSTATKPIPELRPNPTLGPALGPASKSSQSVESNSSQALESKALQPTQTSITNIEAFVVAASGDKVQLKKLQAGKGDQPSSVLTQPVLYDAVEKLLYIVSSEGSKLTVPHKVCEIGGEAVIGGDGNPVVILTNRKGQESYFIVNQETQTLQPSNPLLQKLAAETHVIGGQASSDARYLQKADLRSLATSNGADLMKNIFIHNGTPVVKIPNKDKLSFVYRSLEDFSKDIENHIGLEIKKLSESKTSVAHAIRIKKETEKNIPFLERLKQASVIYKALLKTEKISVPVISGQIKNIVEFNHSPGGEGIQLVHKVGDKNQQSLVEYNPADESLYVRVGQTDMTIPHEVFKVKGEPVKDCDGNQIVVVQDEDGANDYYAIDVDAGALLPIKSLLTPLAKKDESFIIDKNNDAYQKYKKNIDTAALIKENVNSLRERVFIHSGIAMLKVPTTQGDPLFVFRPLSKVSEEIILLNAEITSKFSESKATGKDLITYEKEIIERLDLASRLEKISTTYSELAEESFGVLEKTEAFKSRRIQA
ncbi:hypothetical protein HC248_03256 [Polaromonas vacuolata]|uniref:Uncharacterized protein n=1 Tax=Polaromonas vacuolata TaxID=37448 RepID=A0A6H2HEB7_9BURK|nr:hypothetical protein [Polaromonas vacuolata]QJC57924.1 hypothetical protein HC248_03256 [Polaromonas vacuolata]